MKNAIEFRVWGRYALFSDPATKIGGEKCSYHIPTYEALKGVVKSIYWKPTLIWYVDKVRVINRIKTQTKGAKPLMWSGGNSLAIYTYLSDVEYQVQAHFEWNMHRPELAHDRIEGKHFQIAQRTLDKGGRQDIFLGVRDCQGYIEPCEFGSGSGAYDDLDELTYSMMFFGFQYPDETGKNELKSLFWSPIMRNGIIEFSRPDECKTSRFVRPMEAKVFSPGTDFIEAEADELI